MDAISAPPPGSRQSRPSSVPPPSSPPPGEASLHADRVGRAVGDLDAVLAEGSRSLAVHAEAFEQVHQVLVDALAQTER